MHSLFEHYDLLTAHASYLKISVRSFLPAHWFVLKGTYAFLGYGYDPYHYSLFQYKAKVQGLYEL